MGDLHRVDQYALDVQEGRILAGPYVRLACDRHWRDRKNAAAKGFEFHPEAADHVIDFIERYVRLPDTADESGQPKPFHLEPWQAFIVGSLFGWRWTSGYRRFRNGYIEVGKGNGKTPLLAAIGLYGLTMDGQKAPEIYAAAADRDQAMIMFRDAVRMVDASPELSQRIKKSGVEHVYNLSYGLGFFRPFSREQSAKSGTRPHMGLIDELHEHPNPEIVNKIRAGAKGNRDASMVEITNSGFDRTSVCWEHHEHSRRIVEQAVEDDRWFAYVCALDESDDPLVDEACWPKVNPNLGISIHREYLQDQVSAAKNIPGETNTVLRLNFCIWTQAQTRFLAMDAWRKCPPMPSEDELRSAPCFAAFDLGASDDLSALVRIWLLPDGRVAVKPNFWTPIEALERFPHRPYPEWRKHDLALTNGTVTDFRVVQDAIRDICKASGVIRCGFDDRFARQMAQQLEGEGLSMVKCEQNFKLASALWRLSDLVTDRKLCHGDHPILTIMADNAIVQRGRDREIRLDKDKAADKIDGIAALTMALAVSMLKQDEKHYQMFFVGGRA